MLGRRAVVGAFIAAFAVTGGGIAVAATHGSSHTQAPKVHKVNRQLQQLRQNNLRVGHCHHDGTAATSAAL